MKQGFSAPCRAGGTAEVGLKKSTDLSKFPPLCNNAVRNSGGHLTRFVPPPTAMRTTQTAAPVRVPSYRRHCGSASAGSSRKDTWQKLKHTKVLPPNSLLFLVTQVFLGLLKNS